MPYPITVVAVGADLQKEIEEISGALNSVQNEFEFLMLSPRLRSSAIYFSAEEYHAEEIFRLLRDMKNQARGHHPFWIAVVDQSLHSDTWKNLFGCSRAADGVAAITLHDHKHYVESFRPFLCYNLIHYAVLFACPSHESHLQTRDCFFDFKQQKADIKESLDSGNFCPQCKRTLWKHLSVEAIESVQRMVNAMKSLHANSKELLDAESYRNQTDVAIVTVTLDEHEAMLRHFASWRRMKGNKREYQFSRVKTRENRELGVAISRCPAQGHNAAQALVSNLITDLNPRWILLVGIAGGFPDHEFSLGDVLLARTVHDVTVGAAVEGRLPEFTTRSLSVHRKVENLLDSLSANTSLLGDWNGPQELGMSKPSETIPTDLKDERLYGAEAWRSKVLESLNQGFSAGFTNRNPRFVDRDIISGNTLLKDSKLAEILLTNHRKAAGVEMELGGSLYGAYYASTDPPPVLGIKGISDIIGYRRVPAWTDFACRSAASLAYTLIVSGLFSD